MILLDTNYLIRVLVPGSDEAFRIKAWMRDGQTLCTSSVCWYEFLVGPVGNVEISVVEGLLRGGVLPFGRAEAQEAARLWTLAGRAKTLRVDAMIGAAAQVAQTTLATANSRDFSRFVDGGLQFAPIP